MLKLSRSGKAIKDGGKLILQTYSHVNAAHSARMAQLMSDQEPGNVIPLHGTAPRIAGRPHSDATAARSVA